MMICLVTFSVDFASESRASLTQQFLKTLLIFLINECPNCVEQHAFAYELLQGHKQGFLIDKKH